MFIPKFNVEEELLCSVGIHSQFFQYAAAEGTHIRQLLFILWEGLNETL